MAEDFQHFNLNLGQILYHNGFDSTLCSRDAPRGSFPQTGSAAHSTKSLVQAVLLTMDSIL